MATYAELLTAAANAALRDKVKVAVIVAAAGVRAEAWDTPGHGARLSWAKRAFADPDTEATRMLWALLAEFKDLPIAAITGATDAQVQTAVSNAVALFVT